MNIKKIFKRIRKIFKKKSLPVVYDQNNRPFRRPLKSKKSKIHKYQRPSQFTKTEVDEILQNTSTKKDELKLS